ncbi:MAG: ABC transporter permease [Nitratireductor sp.]|nr:ABC transporter permease [Nitratireductor sp.]
MKYKQVNPMQKWQRLSGLLTLLVLIFLILPIVIIMPLSLSSGSFLSYPMPGFSMRWYEELLTNYKWTKALQNSAIIGISSAVLAMVIGLMAAIGINAMKKGAARAVVMGLFIAPLMTPLIIMAVSLFLFYSKLGLSGKMLGIIIAHAILGTPFVVVSVFAGLQKFDMTLMRAAKSLGASSWYAYRNVMFPILKPAVVSGLLFAFVTSFDEIIIVLFLAGPDHITLPIRLFEGIRDELTPVVISAAMVMVLISVGSMGLIEWVRRRSEAAKEA